jgi:polygalacturonase
VRNLNVKNSQQIHITFKNCFGVEASNLVVTAPEHSPNTDGIHITASTFVVVQNSVIGTGDDCVSIVSDSFDIVIQNVNCGPGHGISIGSLGKGKSEARVAGVLVDRVFLHDTTNGLRIKTWQTSAVEVSEVWYDNISGTSATDEAIRFACSDSVPCENILLRNIDLRLTSGDAAASFCESVMGFSLGSVTPPSCFEDWAAEFHQGEGTIVQVVNPRSKDEL